MKVPLLDLDAQLREVRAEVLRSLEEVVDSKQYIMGPWVTRLEKEIAAYADASFACAIGSGTDALLVALMALEVQPGDIVLTTPYTFFATAGVIARVGATPVFVDIDPDTYNIDPAALRAWFEKNKDKARRVKAIVPVHLYGQCADMDPILELAKEYAVAVVEDAAQAIGSRYPSKQGVKKAGSMGTCGCFSFYPTKNLGTMGEGGMVVTNDEQLATRIARLRNHGMEPRYYHSMIGGNFRMHSMQAAVLLVKFPHLEKWHAMRQANAAYYDANLQAAGVKKPALAYERDFHIYHQYTISVPGKRDELRAFLAKNDISSEIYYPLALHQQECFRYLGYREGDFPNAEYAAAHTVALPIYSEITREMQDYVMEKVMEFYG